MWIYKEFPSKSMKAQLKRKLKAGKWGYAQMEFDEFVARDKRETIRKELDRVNESLDAYQKQVDNPKNSEETKKLFKTKIEETEKAIKLLKEKMDDMDRGLQLAEDTKDELHYQETMLKTFIERNY